MPLTRNTSFIRYYWIATIYKSWIVNTRENNVAISNISLCMPSVCQVVPAISDLEVRVLNIFLQRDDTEDPL